MHLSVNWSYVDAENVKFKKCFSVRDEMFRKTEFVALICCPKRLKRQKIEAEAIKNTWSAYRNNSVKVCLVCGFIVGQNFP